MSRADNCSGFSKAYGLYFEPRRETDLSLTYRARAENQGDWNPMGFGDALPADEYDSYIAPVYRIMVGSRSEQELIDFLFSTEREIIAVRCESPEQLRPVARRLLELDIRL